jgi:hypothetical protein
MVWARKGPGMEPRIVVHDDHLCIAWWHNVQILELVHGVRPQHMAPLRQSYTDLIARFPDGIVSLTTVRLTGPRAPTTQQVSREASELLKSLGSSLKHVAVVMDTPGIRGAMVRTVLRGIAVLMNQPFVFKIYNDSKSAAEAVRPLVRTPSGHGVTAGEMLVAINSLQERYRKLRSTADDSQPNAIR